MAARWSEEALTAVTVLNQTKDWPTFHASYPDLSYDAWETKRRRVDRTAFAEEVAADQVADEASVLAELDAYAAKRGAFLPQAPSLGPIVPTPDVVNFKIGFFDYETTGLKSNFGRTLCMSVTDAFDNLKTFRGDDPRYLGRNRRDDGPLVAATRDALESYDILCSWNGKRFDLRYLNGRLMLAGERPLRSDIMHIDLLPISRHYLAWHSHRLDAVAKTLRLATQKTELNFDSIEAARDGEAWAMDEIVEHCEHDVRVLRQVFARYQPLLNIVHR